jgi:PhzF family phenazine biosynthesis protein
MQLTLYQVDAFTGRIFGGNPAAVVPLSQWPADEVMQHIAAENNLSETAFFTGTQGRYDLRWFTPVAEVDLCGHATLATAWVLYHRLHADFEQLRFQTRSGELRVARVADGLLMDFPSQPASRCIPPVELLQALAIEPQEVLEAEDYMVVFQNEQQVRDLKPDLLLLKKIPLRGVVVTAPGEEADFVSRMFGPKIGIDEDPATGSSHCSLTPYWADKFGKSKLVARQLSKRGGEMLCELDGQRVRLTGQCVEYMQATIYI